MKRFKLLLVVILVMVLMLPAVALGLTEEQTEMSSTAHLYTGYQTREGQRLTISNRLVTELSFKLSSYGSPTGDVTFTIRKVSDDSIINSKIWGDASGLGVPHLWEEVTFDTPVIINEEVRISCEYTSGNSSNYVLVDTKYPSVKDNEVASRYTDSWIDQPTLDCTYIYTYEVTLPAITTNDATYIERTTARLNSYLNNDGGEPCDVRFQYSTSAGGGGNYENFSNFTEVDPNNHLNLTDYHVDHRADDNEDCYLYDDKGAGNITGFTHGAQIEAARLDANAHGFPWLVANVTNDAKGLKDASEPYLEIYLYGHSGTVVQINLVEGDSGNSYTDTYSGAWNTSYYLTLIKDSTDFSCEIFSDAGRTVSLDLLNLTLHKNHTFRYIYAGNTWNDGTNEQMDVDIDNLCLTGTGAGWTNTTWINDTYTTGDSPYADVSGLTNNTKHYFRVQVRNANSTVSGGELNFTTYPTIYEPTNFTGYPSSTTISLAWNKGIGATNTMVRGQAGDYPANYSSGDQVYASIMATAIHSSLTPGTTYYYRSWSFDDASYSDNYTDYLMTTTAYTATSNDTPATPTQPSNWWGTPDYTNLENIAGYAFVNEIAEQYGIPYNTFWMSLILIAIMCIGLFIYSVQHNVTVALGLMGVLIIVASAAELLPLWLIAAIGIPVAGIMLVKRRI